MKEQNIEQLFNNGLSNFEADVNPNAWTNIEQGLQAPTGQFSKSPAGSTSLSSYGGWLLAVVSAGIMLAVYLDTRKSSSDVEAILSSKTIVDENTVSIPRQEQLTYSTAENSKTTEVPKATSAQSEQKTTGPNKGNASHGIPLLANSVDTRKKVAASENTTQQVEKHQTATPESISSTKENSAASETSRGTSTQPDNAKGVPDASDEKGSINNTSGNLETENTTLKIFFPKAFTPDGDGTNDKFLPVGEDVSEFTLIIYDSKGTTIFTSREASEAWDGKLRTGEDAAPGVYTYAAYVKDQASFAHAKNGRVILKR